LIQFLDYLGVFVFAITGALLASRKGMDVFGYVVLALMPAVGGGTLRDLILDAPVFWIGDVTYLFITLSAALICFLAHRHLAKRQPVIVWFDAIGLSVFCVLGASKALSLTQDATVAVVMGVVTAVAGGIVRDVIANEVPLILQKELYATAAFFGALALVLFDSWSVPGGAWLAVGIAFAVRSLGILTGLSLPRSGASQ